MPRVPRARWSRGQACASLCRAASLNSSGDDVELRVKGQAGFAVSRDGAEVVALDLALNDELRRRGLLRDVVRQIQDLRKNSGLDVADRIVLHVVGLDDLRGEFVSLAAKSSPRDVDTTPGIGRGNSP